jgi:hypothetical protein
MEGTDGRQSVAEQGSFATAQEITLELKKMLSEEWLARHALFHTWRAPSVPSSPVTHGIQ